MPRIVVLLLALCFAAVTARAIDHVSDQHRFRLSVPDSESWMRGNMQPLGPNAEIVFSLVNMESREGAIVAMIPKIPSGNIMNQAVIIRIVEVLTLQGFTVISHAPRMVRNVEYLEFIGKRTDETNAKVISVSRAIMRGDTILVATAFGRGDEDRALDTSFLRVIDTFRLLEEPSFMPAPQVDLMHSYYRLSYIGCLAAAGVLALLFATVMFSTRKRFAD